MSLTIYHNPRCSKSRETLRLIEEAGQQAAIVLYLDTPPDGSQILELARLAGVRVADLLRTGEDEYRQAKDLPDRDNDAALAEWIAAHPRVLQRPLVVNDDSTAAVIGRPPENVRKLFAE